MGRTRYGVPDEIKETAEALYRAASNKNLKAIDNLWVHSPYAAVAGRSGKIRQGWSEVRRYWEQRFERLGDTRVTVRLTGAVSHAVGDVGWLSGTETRTITEDGQMRKETLRMTCVLERKGSGWQIVSYHASEGTENEPAALAS
jgi:ketosteroid isomerase-like protein